jgi:hypothetical protein
VLNSVFHLWGKIYSKRKKQYIGEDVTLEGMLEVKDEDMSNLFELYIQGVLSDPSVSLTRTILTDGVIQFTFPEDILKCLTLPVTIGVLKKVQLRGDRLDSYGVKFGPVIKFFDDTDKQIHVIGGKIMTLHHDLRGLVGINVKSRPLDIPVANAFCAFVNGLGGQISDVLPRPVRRDINGHGDMTECYVFNRAQIHNVCVDGDLSSTTEIRVLGTKFYLFDTDVYQLASFPAIYFVDHAGNETRPCVKGATIESLMWEHDKVICLKKQHSGESTHGVAVYGQSQVIQTLKGLSETCDRLLKQAKELKPSQKS